MSAEKLHEQLCAIGDEVIAAWFHDSKFRESWRPDPGLFATAHQKAIAQIMAVRGADLDDGALTLELRNRGQLEQVPGGATGVADLIHGTPQRRTSRDALVRLKELSTLRDLRNRLQTHLRQAEASLSLEELRTATAEALAGTEPSAAEAPRVQSAKDIFASANKRAFSRDPVEFLTTAHYRLDDITGGIRAPDNWVIAADTSWGKSSFVIAIADENMRNRKKRVLIVSAEDSDEVYGGRFVVRRTRLPNKSRVDAKRYRNRKLTNEEIRACTETEARGEPEPAYIDVRQRPIEELAPMLVRTIEEHNIDLIVFDYLQEFESKKKFQDERVKFKHIAKQMREIGRVPKRKIPTIILSQLTLSEKTGIPTRANIRECRDVANAADTILIGFEPEQDVKDKSGRMIVEAGTKCVYIDKCKGGQRKGKIAMAWNDTSACFDTVHDPEVQRFHNVVGDQFDDFATDDAGPF